MDTDELGHRRGGRGRCSLSAGAPKTAELHLDRAVLPVGARLKYTAYSGAISALERANRISTRLTQMRIDLHWRRFGVAYRGSPNDIFIVSYAKSGTTLTQMLVYQLLTDGELTFKHISEFCPFLEFDITAAHAPGVDVIGALQTPHVLKSHLPHSSIPAGPGRYIYVMRNGLDVAVSLYHQLGRGPRTTKPFESVLQGILDGQVPTGSWLEHVKGWVQNKRGLRILYVTYEDLVTDLLGQARRVAEFCGKTIPDSEWPRICANCSFGFMRQHEKKLDGFVHWNERGEDKHFIRKGQVGGWQGMVDADMLREFHARYDAVLGGLALPEHLRGKATDSVSRSASLEGLRKRSAFSAAQTVRAWMRPSLSKTVAR